MSAQPDTLFRRYPANLAPVPLWHSRPGTRPLNTVETVKALDAVPRCSRCRTDLDRRACRALSLKRDGLDWVRVALEVGYTNGEQAKRMALAHLLAEM